MKTERILFKDETTQRSNMNDSPTNPFRVFRSSNVEKPLTKSADEVFGRLHQTGQPHRSVAQMKEAVLARMKSTHTVG